MGRTHSPLRYPGGKSQFYDQVLQLININKLHGCTYVEPFVGGAGVAVRLLIENVVDQIVINDYDISIYSFWYTVLHFPEWFCEKIENTPVTIAEYYVQKDIQESKQTADLRELGFSTFFLNRTNRSGILKAGPIGGYDQSGSYKLDCRFNKIDLMRKIRGIAELRERIQLCNLDAIEFLERNLCDKTQKYFIFLDPPYYKKGKELYINFYDYDNHVKLANFVSDQLGNQQWIITYDVCDEIKTIYRDVPCIEVGLNYSVQTKKAASEYLFYNKILVPDSI